MSEFDCTGTDSRQISSTHGYTPNFVKHGRFTHRIDKFVRFVVVFHALDNSEYHPLARSETTPEVSIESSEIERRSIRFDESNSPINSARVYDDNLSA